MLVTFSNKAQAGEEVFSTSQQAAKVFTLATLPWASKMTSQVEPNIVCRKKRMKPGTVISVKSASVQCTMDFDSGLRCLVVASNTSGQNMLSLPKGFHLYGYLPEGFHLYGPWIISTCQNIL